MTTLQMLDRPVTSISGIGKKRAQALQEMGIDTVFDLLYHFPFRYEQYEPIDIQRAAHEAKVTVAGKVLSLPVLKFYGKKKSRLTFQLQTGQSVIQAVIFNRPFLKNRITAGAVVTVTGIWDRWRARVTVHEFFSGNRTEKRAIQPVYPVKGSWTAASFRKFMQQVLPSCLEEVEETLPDSLRTRYRLPKKKEALKTLHAPENFYRLKHARRRIVYEEFLLFQLKLAALKLRRTHHSIGRSLPINRLLVTQFIKRLPFSLTAAQQRAVEEILHDMESGRRMMRLLQGDVGSGKTAVAAIALFSCAQARYQGAFMVPTEILAEQHFQSLRTLYDGTVSVALLTGSTKGQRRREILQQLEKGEIDVVVGTHALIQETVHFARLGLVVTDEQHRFGVVQRKLLNNKGGAPDVLYMSATPIPRTLALSLYGDLDVTTIDEMPGGRKPVQTYWVKTGDAERVFVFVEKELRKGRQAYFICPLIDESDAMEGENAIHVYRALQKRFPSFQVALMHGKLSSEEKDDVMRRFSENRCHILVATTVVEVGVHVPNATVMVIYDAERFGLAQLHQLRGRVGRGNEQAYCILLADPKSENGKERMRTMQEINDGFLLAEKDMRMRGAGDFFGKKQSGLPEFKLADPVHDARALAVAREDARRMLGASAFYNDSAYASLRNELLKASLLPENPGTSSGG